jgi:hypothetical protein
VPSLDEKRENAIAAAKSMITLLERCGASAWAARMYPILNSLEARDLDDAITRYKEIPMTGMGGFLDLILSEEGGHTIRDYDADNKLLERTRGALGKTIGNLRVCLKYEFDRPLVTIPDAT